MELTGALKRPPREGICILGKWLLSGRLLGDREETRLLGERLTGSVASFVRICPTADGSLTGKL